MEIERTSDISDTLWRKLRSHLPGSRGSWGGKAKDNRRFINAVFWILRTGSSWRQLPPEYGGWSNTHRRFIRWRDNGTWEKVLEVVIDAPELKWLLKVVHPIEIYAQAKSFRVDQNIFFLDNESLHSYAWPWLRLVCHSELLLQKIPQLY